MKALMLVLALVMLLASGARAEENMDAVIGALDTAQLEQVAETAGIDFVGMVKDLARNGLPSPEQMLEELAEWARGQLSWMSGTLAALVIPALMWGLVQQLAQTRGAAKTAGYVCYLGVAAALVTLLNDCMIEAHAAVEGIGTLCEALFPVLSALLVSTGASTTAAGFTPMAALLGALLSGLIRQVAFALCACVAALTIAGNLNQHHPLDALTGLLRSLCGWLLCTGLSVFLGLLTIQGVLGAGSDGASMRTARYAVDSLLPVVGSEVADTLDAVVGSTLLVKNAVGVAGAATLIALCAQPVLRVAASIVVCRLAAALAEPISAGGAQKLLSQFAGALGMLLAALTTALVLMLMLIGAVISSGNAVLMLR